MVVVYELKNIRIKEGIIQKIIFSNIYTVFFRNNTE